MEHPPTSMRVLFYNDYSSKIGGAEIYLDNIVNHLNKRKIETKKIAFNPTHCIFNSPSIIERAKSIWLKHSLQEHIVQKFKAVINSFQPDIVHLNKNSLYTASINKVIKESCLPSICTIHDHYSLPFHQDSHSNREYIIPSLSFFRELNEKNITRLNYIPHFIDTTQWQFKKHAPKYSNQLLYVGRLEESKGIYVLLEAMCWLKKINPSVKLVCIGKGEKEAKIQKFIQANQLQAHLQFLGHQKQSVIQQYFHESAILLFPSIKAEIFGLVGIEAQASGIPVIASDVGGTREWCIDRKTGILVRPNEVRSLCNNIQKLLSNPSLRRELTDNAYQFVVNRFNKEQAIEKLIQLYRQMLKNDSQKAHR